MPTAREQSSGQNAAARPISFTFGQREDDFVNCESACGRHHTPGSPLLGLVPNTSSPLEAPEHGNRCAFLPVPLAKTLSPSDMVPELL